MTWMCGGAGQRAVGVLGVGLLLGCAGIVGDAKIEAPIKTTTNTSAGQPSHKAPTPNTPTAEEHTSPPPADAQDATAAANDDTLICDRVIDDFSTVAPGAFPSGWETPDRGELQSVKQSGAFVVEQDGAQRVLHARYRRKSVMLGHGVDGWDLSRYPIVQWRWKAVKLPAGGNEIDSDTDDSAASVQAVWLIGFPFMVRQLKYTWSSTLAVGTRASNRLGHDQLVVLESGPQYLGQWRSASVNVLEHYREFFGETDAAAPTGISLQTDADATASMAEAYYADFRLCRHKDP